MSENIKVEENNKDVTSVDETAVNKETVNEVNTRPQKESSSGNGLVYIVIFLVAGITAAGAYYLWDVQNNYNTVLTKQSKQMGLLESTLNKVTKSAEEVGQRNDQTISQIREQIQLVSGELSETTKISQQAIEVVNRSQRDWALAEVDYLLRMAHSRLEVSGDIYGAVAALKGADSRLQQLADLKLFEIRKQIAKDIADLNAIKQVDVSGIALALDQVLINLVNLPFKSVQEEVKTQLEEPVKEEVKTEKTFVDSVIKTVKKIGDIKIHQRSLKVAKGEKQQTQIEQLLHTHVLGARLALLNKDQAHYIYEINQSIKLIKNNYDQADERVKQLVTDLESRLEIELNPQLPNLVDAWSMLQTELNKPVIKVKQEPKE